MSSTIAKALDLILGIEKQRAVEGRSVRLTHREQVELRLIVDALGRQIDSPQGRAVRGAAATALFDYQDAYDEIAATVITDILWAAKRRGYEPFAVVEKVSGYLGGDLFHDQVTEG